MSFRLHTRALADLLLPRRCLVCGRKLHVREEHICLYCLSDLPQTYFHTMGHNPMADRFNHLIQNGLDAVWEDFGLSACAAPPTEHYVHASALFFYREDSDYRHIPYQIKYHGNINAGRYFGRMLGRRLSEASWTADVDVVIPVPLHWRRRWARGYNQAQIIAEEVADVLGVPVRTDILRRVRSTRTQTRLNIADKTVNVEGAFRVDVTPETGISHILLIDDVFTTGSTLGACFNALRKVFPSSVRISIATLGFVGD